MSVPPSLHQGLPEMLFNKMGVPPEENPIILATPYLRVLNFIFSKKSDQVI